MEKRVAKAVKKAAVGPEEGTEHAADDDDNNGVPINHERLRLCVCVHACMSVRTGDDDDNNVDDDDNSDGMGVGTGASGDEEVSAVPVGGNPRPEGWP